MHKGGLALKLSNTSFFLEINFKSIHPWIWTVVCLLLGEGGQQFLFLMNCSVTLSSSVTDVFPEDPSSQVCVVTPTTNSLDCLWSCEYDGVTSSAVCGNFLTVHMNQWPQHPSCSFCSKRSSSQHNQHHTAHWARSANAIVLPETPCAVAESGTISAAQLSFLPKGLGFELCCTEGRAGTV